MSQRCLGIASADTSAIGRFETVAERTASAHGAERLDLVRAHRDGTKAAALIDRQAYPACTAYQAPDGSFCIIDGQIFSIPCVSKIDGGDPQSLARQILDAYRTRGLSAFETMDAAAFVVLFLAGRGEALVVRDPIGNTPVFYSLKDGSFFWSSDLPSLAAVTGQNRLDETVADFFVSRGYVPAPWSLVDGVTRIPPGHAVRWTKDASVRCEPYTRLTGKPERKPQDVMPTLEDALPKAVRKRVRDIGQTGILLSGGVDSKLLLALTAREFGRAPDSFTFRYKNYDGPLNEADVARACAEHFGSNHFEIEVDPLAIPDRLSHMLAAFGEPFSYGLHTALLGRAGETGVKDLLCGTGADGMYVSGVERNALRFRSLPGPVRLAMSGTVKAYRWAEVPVRQAGRATGLPGIGPAMKSLNRGIWIAENGVPYYLGDYMLRADLRRTLYRDDALLPKAQAAAQDLYTEARGAYAGESEEARYKFLNTRYYGAEMMQNWNHASGRAFGLAIFAPYYDLELQRAIARFKMPEKGKPHLRAFAATMMPREMAYYPKIFQSVPIRDWYDGPLSDFFADNLSPARLDRHRLFNPAAVQKLQAAHKRGLSDFSWPLWNIMILTKWQDWLAEYVAGSALRPS